MGATHMVEVIGHLKEIAHQVANICERVVFLATGKMNGLRC